MHYAVTDRWHGLEKHTDKSRQRVARPRTIWDNNQNSPEFTRDDPDLVDDPSEGGGRATKLDRSGRTMRNVTGRMAMLGTGVGNTTR